eukprot:5234316-Pleurochrysis_carterae.AAC.4
MQNHQVKRRYLQVAVGVATEQQLGEVLGLQPLGAIGDVVAIATVSLEQLLVNLERVGLVQRCADLLDVCLARDMEELLLDKRHLALDNFVWRFAAVVRQLDAKERRKNQEE